MSNNSRSLKNIASIVAIATLISKLFGLLRSTCIAAIFGVGAVANAFNYAYIIPGFLLIVIGGLNGPLHTALVSVLARRDERNSAELVANIATLLTLILIPVTLGIIILKPFFNRLSRTGIEFSSKRNCDFTITNYGSSRFISGINWCRNW